MPPVIQGPGITPGSFFSVLNPGVPLRPCPFGNGNLLKCSPLFPGFVMEAFPGLTKAGTSIRIANGGKMGNRPAFFQSVFGSSTGFTSIPSRAAESRYGRLSREAGTFMVLLFPERYVLPGYCSSGRGHDWIMIPFSICPHFRSVQHQLSPEDIRNWGCPGGGGEKNTVQRALGGRSFC